MLFALSGAPRAAFERFGQPRNTDVFAPTFSGQGVVRVDDITRDPRYGRNPAASRDAKGPPAGQELPGRAGALALGEVIGGLFFGHPEPGVFTERAERLIVGVAAQAAIAIDNGRLYQAAQREIAERTRAEAHQRLLMNELNHRVKNTLATVQSMGAQTLKTGRSLAEAREAFVERLMALSAAHNLLTAERWESADLEDVVRMAVQAFDEPPGARFAIHGPGVRLKASSALGLAMALHELGANATRHGALSEEDGKVDVGWERLPGGRLEFAWRESGGPPVAGAAAPRVRLAADPGGATPRAARRGAHGLRAGRARLRADLPPRPGRLSGGVRGRRDGRGVVLTELCFRKTQVSVSLVK
jgi:two-component sensor histidine kinase